MCWQCVVCGVLCTVYGYCYDAISVFHLSARWKLKSIPSELRAPRNAFSFHRNTSCMMHDVTQNARSVPDSVVIGRSRTQAIKTFLTYKHKRILQECLHEGASSNREYLKIEF
jgi:hypothetical protein